MDKKTDEGTGEETVEVELRFLTPDTRLAYPTFSETGKKVQESHIVFTEERINQLLASGIKKIHYKVPPEIKVRDTKPAIQAFLEKSSYKGPRVIKPETQMKAVQLMTNLVRAINDYMIEFNSEDLGKLVDAINDDIDKSEDEIINLLDMIEYDDYTYTHSLNVGIISMFFAKKLRVEKSLIKEIGIGAFLHDIGKINLSKEILNKEDQLSPHEYVILQEHAELGYQMVKNNYTMGELPKEIILHHHERYDGSGYPRGLKENEIKNYVEIVALADVFDALTSKSPIGKSLNTADALEMMMSQGKQYRPSLLQRFVKEMIIFFREGNFYPVDSYVLLNTNELAKIVVINAQSILRPKVNIISNQHGKRLVKPIPIDLNIDISRNIVRRMS
ncbi:MAG: hypothetical protein IEMM0008_0187 [bacterium]|nr:MAG: hypothetical protein IEMM0008_0187 [bacterium]